MVAKDHDDTEVDHRRQHLFDLTIASAFWMWFLPNAGSQVRRLQTRALADSGEHPRPDLLAFMERENEVGPLVAGKCAVRTADPLDAASTCRARELGHSLMLPGR